MTSPIRRATQQVYRALQRQSPQPEDFRQPQQLSGWCELAEAIAYHELQEDGYRPSQLHSNQVGELGGKWRHAFLVAEDEQGAHLIDPTFPQFLCEEPGQRLSQSPQGRELLGRLLEEGHAPWNRETARVYAQAFDLKTSLYDEALSSQRLMPYQKALFASLLEDS